jgi:hypothetical protein
MICAWRLVGAGIQTMSRSSHFSICAQATGPLHLVVDEILRSERCKARYRLRTPVGPFEHDLAGPYAVRNGFAQAGGEELAHPLGVLRKVHQVVQQA